MPNFDSGTYFLTVLAPVDSTGLVQGGKAISSPVHMLREYLEILPTAQQSDATRHPGVNSPFARNRRNHFVRLVVIDDVAYNGREQPSTLYTSLAARFPRLRSNPILSQPQDKLSCPYLLFVADFDADGGDRSELAAYLALLWQTMDKELREIFQYCADFGGVETAEDFVVYIEKCQIETTMPFHDYWEDRPQLASYLVSAKALSLPLWPFAIWAAGVPLLHLAKLLAKALGFPVQWKFPSLGLWLAVSLVLGIAGIWLTIVRIRQWSARPIPAAPDATLPHVLKALYLQRKLTGFIMANQTSGPARLHEAFGAFLAEHEPANIAAGPTTQSAGTIP